MNRPERYVFALRVHPDQFSFTLHEPENEASFFYYEIARGVNSDVFANFKQFFFENPLLASPFKRIYIMNYSGEFTFVPDFLYEKENEEELIRFNFSHFSGKLLNQEVDRMKILHQMPKDTYQFLNRSFINPRFIHHLSPLIRYFQKKQQDVNASRLIVNLWNKDLDILCFSDDRFILGNHYRVEQIQEAVYYTLFVWKQLKLEQIQDTLFVLGIKEQKQQLISKLKPFIQNIISVDGPQQNPFVRTDMQYNIPFELSSLSLCEL